MKKSASYPWDSEEERQAYIKRRETMFSLSDELWHKNDRFIKPLEEKGRRFFEAWVATQTQIEKDPSGNQQE